ncbi:MAG: methyltransferase domain-containing protein [Armatimonadota bacterium]|nr:methyltransferase domain-containing protein [bacterium]
MTQTQFKQIATYYDDLMAGVPYNLWVRYIENILKRIEHSPRTVLDLACGTGNVSELMAEKGYKVVGADIAPDMIEVARSKNSDVEYHVQDMAELDLDGRRFDLAISLFDSLNYILDPNRLAKAIERVGEHLVEGGIFIFDVNTEYALAHHFFDQANIASNHYPHYVWNSEYDNSTRICTVNMTFRVVEDGENVEFKEVHLQRAHSLEELTMMLTDAGFDVVDIFHAYKFRRPTRRSDRVFYVARKVI